MLSITTKGFVVIDVVIDVVTTYVTTYYYIGAERIFIILLHSVIWYNSQHIIRSQHIV